MQVRLGLAVSRPGGGGGAGELRARDYALAKVRPTRSCLYARSCLSPHSQRESSFLKTYWSEST